MFEKFTNWWIDKFWKIFDDLNNCCETCKYCDDIDYFERDGTCMIRHKVVRIASSCRKFKKKEEQ